MSSASEENLRSRFSASVAIADSHRCLVPVLAALDQFAAECDTLLAERSLDEFAGIKQLFDTSLQIQSIIEEVLTALQT
jgi:hypothetical protein